MKLRSGLIILLIAVITSGCVHTSQIQNPSNATSQTQTPPSNQSSEPVAENTNGLDDRFDEYDTVAYDGENFSIVVYKKYDEYDLSSTGTVNFSKIVSSTPDYSSKKEAAMGILKPMCRRVQRKSFRNGSTNQVPAAQKLTFKVSDNAGKIIKNDYTVKMESLRDYLETHDPIRIQVRLRDTATGNVKADCEIRGKGESHRKITIH